MAQPERGDSSNSFPSIILVLIMSVGAILVNKAPLPSSRPSEPPAAAGNYTAQQNIDARLWQDPLEAIHPSAPKPGPAITAETQSVQTNDGVLQVEIKLSPPPSPLTSSSKQSVCEAKTDNEPVQVMAVMVNGAPYAEAAEARRRTRYAVLSGLGRSGYIPEDREHLGRFTTSVTQLGDQASDKPGLIDIPFEWFRYDDTKTSANLLQKRILVLWIDEIPIRDNPLNGIKQIVEQACFHANQTETVILGPSSSDTLRAMLADAKRQHACCVAGEKPNAFLRNLRIYSPRATAPDAHLLQSTGLSGAASSDNAAYCSRAGGSISAELMDKAGLKFHRTISTDCDLAKALVDELRLRDVKANDGIVLISEWDTTYGRALPEAFKEMNQAKQGEKTLWQFSYLRGLDGKLPGDGADKKTDPGKKSSDNEKPDIEMPFGNHQKDYLRRIAARVADFDQRLKHCEEKSGDQKSAGCKKGGVKAIGILGSDVYDKLLILKALHDRFPEVIFFTTDLDAGLLHADEWDSARNLIVASGYGLRLNGWLQNDIPPFRDGYQTAYFLSVLATTQLEGKNEREIANIVKRGTSFPRIFEIGRSQEMDLSKTVEDSIECDLATCHSPHPYISPPNRPHWYQVLPLPLLLLGFWYFQLKPIAYFHFKPEPGIRGTLRKWVLELGTLLLLVWLGWIGFGIWNDIFDRGTAGGGEPFTWFEGVSVWPSILLRAFTGLLALYLLLRGMHHLRESDEKLTAEFFGKDTKEEKLIIDRTQPIPCGRNSHKAVFIWRDAVHPRPFTLPMLGRLALGVLLLIVTIGVLLILASGESPNIPYRGKAAIAAHRQTLFFAILSFLFLLVFVIDSTRRTCCLATRLGNRNPTEWPRGMLQKCFGGKPGELSEPVPDPANQTSQYQDDWIDIQLIAARTAVVGNFIYYPFLILSLIILARSSFFDNWQIPVGLRMVFTFYLLLAIVCALLLRNAAERARRHALENLTQEIVMALRDETRKQEVDQMKFIKEAIQAEHRGAFSSFLHQPWLKALLLPLGSYSGIQLVESLSQLNL